MNADSIFLVSAFLLGFVGSLIIMLSGRAYAGYIEASLQMHEVMIHQLIHQDPEQVAFTNLDEFRGRGAGKARRWFFLGLSFLIASNLLHLIRVGYIACWAQQGQV